MTFEKRVGLNKRMSKKLSLGSWIAIAFSILPASLVIGADFWHAFQTTAFADYKHALIGLAIIMISTVIIYLPHLTAKVTYGYEYDNEMSTAFMWAFIGLSMAILAFSLTSGWHNPIAMYECYITVGIMALILFGALIM